MFTSDNPFSGVLSPVIEDDKFIGRELLLRNLRNNVISGAATNVIGLPRMGKTSLVKRCFLSEGFFKVWLEENHMLPVYVEMPLDPNPGSIWLEIAERLDNYFDETDTPTDYMEQVLDCTSTEERYIRISDALASISKRCKLSVILIVDEFDRVLRVPETKDLLQKIRSLMVQGYIRPVICSRRMLRFIERKITHKIYDSNVFKPLFVGVFEDAEVEAYWNHFAPFFSTFPEDHFSAYRQLIRRYAGNHPMLLNLSNNALFELGGDPHEMWNPRLPVSQREQVERGIRVAVNEVFKDQLHYVGEQRLLKTAVQMILGSSHDIPDEHIKLLMNYQFAQVVPDAVKRDIFGYILGPTTKEDVSKRYMCFSALTTHIMNETLSPDIKGFNLLKETEQKLRELIIQFLLDLCGGEDPFREEESFIGDGMSMVRDHWESVLYESVPYFKKNEKVGKRFLDDLNSMRKLRDERSSYDCKPTFNRKKINMVTSSTLGQLWHVFIKWHWTDYYADVFNPAGEYDSGQAWYAAVFKPILDWRNSADHCNEEELPDDFIEYASDRANEVIGHVKRKLGK